MKNNGEPTKILLTTKKIGQGKHKYVPYAMVHKGGYNLLGGYIDLFYSTEPVSAARAEPGLPYH